MTHAQFPLETSNGWTGLFDSERPQQSSRTLSKDEGHIENPAEDSSINEESNAYLNRDLQSETHNGDSQRMHDIVKTDEIDENDEDEEQKVFCLDCCCCRLFPRISLLFVGILFPLWTLISVSTLFGIALSAVESPQEGMCPIP